MGKFRDRKWGIFVILDTVPRRRRAQVLVPEPVAVALEAEDLGVVHQPVDHRRGDHFIAEDLPPQALKGLFEVTINEARS